MNPAVVVHYTGPYDQATLATLNWTETVTSDGSPGVVCGQSHAVPSHAADITVPVVFDHIGNADAALGVNQKGFGALIALVKARNTYVKLSAPYNLSKRSDWTDVVPLAKALIAAGPDRMLWGTTIK